MFVKYRSISSRTPHEKAPHIAIVVRPSSGILDQLVPTLQAIGLENSDAVFSFILQKMSTASEVDTSWWTAEFSNRISHKVLSWTDAGCWIQARNLVEASKIARILGIVERISGTEPFRKILDQSIRLRLSRVIAMFCRAECFDDGALPSPSVSHVLFDITESRKAYFVRLKPLFENDAKLFSILHGANLFNLEDFHSTGKH